MSGKLDQRPEDQPEREKRQRGRNIAIALALGAFALLFYAATIVRMGGNVSSRPLMVSPMVNAWSQAR